MANKRREMYDTGMDDEDTENEGAETKNNLIKKSGGEEEPYTSAFLVHIPGSTAPPYCSKDKIYHHTVNLLWN